MKVLVGYKLEFCIGPDLKGPGVFLMPTGTGEFQPMMSAPARVVFEPGTDLMMALTFEQDGMTRRFDRISSS